MKTIEVLTKQTSDAYEWTHKLINALPTEKWDEIPKVTESNISWQVGHLVISIYYHSVMVIVGHQKDILEKLPMRDYTKWFSFDTIARNAVDKTDPEELQNHLNIIEKKSISVIKALPPENLQDKLEPTKMPHPVAKTKFEAISWNIKHTMWHCGQIAMLKRIVDEAYDYGLRRY
jgi:hypothetical protein